jgi:hypothetical protein
MELEVNPRTIEAWMDLFRAPAGWKEVRKIRLAREKCGVTSPAVLLRSFAEGDTCQT